MSIEAVALWHSLIHREPHHNLRAPVGWTAHRERGRQLSHVHTVTSSSNTGTDFLVRLHSTGGCLSCSLSTGQTVDTYTTYQAWLTSSKNNLCTAEQHCDNTFHVYSACIPCFQCTSHQRMLPFCTGRFKWCIIFIPPSTAIQTVHLWWMTNVS